MKLVRSTWLSRMTGAKQETDEGFDTPARMVGTKLCLDRLERKSGTRKHTRMACENYHEAGHVKKIRTDREGPVGSQDGARTYWSGLSLIIFVVLAIATAMAPAPLSAANAATANPAGLKVAPPPHRASSEATPDELAAARGLEAMLLDMMIQEMRKSVPENDIVPLSQGERIFRQMLDAEYARTISESGTLGIADLVVAQMKGKR
jgi:hypothetical protein